MVRPISIFKYEGRNSTYSIIKSYPMSFKDHFYVKMLVGWYLIGLPSLNVTLKQDEVK